MKTTILAASQGTGLKPPTDNIPKPMIPLINKPVMACVIDHLKRFGARIAYALDARRRQIHLAATAGGRGTLV